MSTFDNTVLTYAAIQRTFRNVVVRYVREKLRGRFGEAAEVELRKPFKAEEWEKVKSGAMEPRALGTVATAVVDEFDLMSVNHFYNVFEKHWEVLKPSNAPVGVHEDVVKKGLLGFLREVKSVRDPMSHPPEADLSREDAFRVIDSARRVLLTLNLPDAETLQRQANDIWSGAAEPVTPLAARIPASDAIVQRFIGRETELLDLWRWLADRDARRWLLVGDGGKGKSALAYEFACSVRDRAPEGLIGVAWLSAKVRRFAEGEVLSDITPDFSTLDEALRQLLAFYDKPPDAETETRELLAICLQLLEELPLLLVVDDVDSIETQEEDVVEFFSVRVPSTRSRVLFTSRRTLLGFGKTTTLVQGFDIPQGTQFIKSRVDMFDLDSRSFGTDSVKRLVRATDGSPLYLEDLLRLSAVAGSLDHAIRAWTERDGAEARRYALGRECEQLTPNAKKVLFAAAASGAPASHEELRGISGVRDENLLSALQELQRLFLIPKPTSADEAGGEWRFELNSNTRRLVQEVYGGSVDYRRAVDAKRAISQGLPRDSRGYGASAIRQASFAVRAGELEKAEEILLRARDSEPANPEIHGFLGYVYKQWSPRRITDARDAFRRAAELRIRKRDTYFHWIRLEMDEKEAAVACEAADLGLKAVPGNRTLLYWGGRAYDLAARQLEAGLHRERASLARERALQYLAEAMTAVDTEGGAPSAGMICKALALTAEAGADHRSVQKFLAQWKEADPSDAEADSDWQRLSGLTPKRRP